MNFHIGDKVIHWAYGLGEIVQIDEKIIHECSTKCYVVRTSNLLIWVPISDLPQQSLRLPAVPDEFEKLFAILSSPVEELLDDRLLRKNQLMEQMRAGQLASICRVVRDLTQFKRSKKLSDHEKSILEQATNSLLSEWTHSLGVPLNQAHQAMIDLLNG